MKKFLRKVRSAGSESGKVGLAVLMWLLGVPGVLVIAYLILG